MKRINIKSVSRTTVKAVLAVLAAAALFTFSSCRSKLVDPPPHFFRITEGPSNGEVLKRDFVLFRWEGSSASFRYRYRLLALDSRAGGTTANYIGYSVWSDTTDVLFDGLDEGLYRFEVSAFFGDAASYQETLTRDFEIDAISGAHMMFNRTKTVMTRGTSAIIYIWLEEMEEFCDAQLSITFDQNIVRLDSVGNGDLANSMGFSQISPLINGTIAGANTTGSLIVNTAVFTSGGIKNISGTGRLLALKFTAIANGTCDLDIIPVDVRRADGIKIHERISVKRGRIEVRN